MQVAVPLDFTSSRLDEVSHPPLKADPSFSASQWTTPCRACRGRRFWRSFYGAVTCAVCHPPAADTLVAAWIEAPAGETDV